MPCNEAFSERGGFGETQKSGFKIKTARIEDKKTAQPHGAAPFLRRKLFFAEKLRQGTHHVLEVGYGFV